MIMMLASSLAAHAFPTIPQPVSCDEVERDYSLVVTQTVLSFDSGSPQLCKQDVFFDVVCDGNVYIPGGLSTPLKQCDCEIFESTGSLYDCVSFGSMP